uniref:Uncharacterized protein n=1 Tax=Rhizophora mucronata TaxID=61149 RepID=A0A2P2PUR8_RHIMU
MTYKYSIEIKSQKLIHSRLAFR